MLALKVNYQLPDLQIIRVKTRFPSSENLFKLTFRISHILKLFLHLQEVFAECAKLWHSKCHQFKPLVESLQKITLTLRRYKKVLKNQN